VPAAPYLLPDDLKGDPTLARLTTIDDDALAAYIAEFEGIAEGYRGVAFTPRTQTDRVIDPPGPGIILSRHMVRTVASVTVDGSTVNPAAVSLDAPAGLLVLPTSGWSLTSLTAPLPVVEVVYEHGFDAPPAGLLRACRQYVRATALRDQQAVERDVIAQGFDGGGYTRYATPGPNNPTGFIEVDRLLNSLPDFRAGTAI